MTTPDEDRGLETPDLDRLEQLRPLDDDQPIDLPTVAVAGSVVDNIDADEADVLEQSIPVPVDDDYQRGDS